jgi:hypothetical protein
MEGRRGDPFGAMEQLLKTWLEMARHREVLRVLELVKDELHRRGYTLSYEVKRGRPSGRPEE